MKSIKKIEVEQKLIDPEVLIILNKAKEIIDLKKIITEDIKEKLIELGFTEKIIGIKREHEISSKQVELDFFGYDIAIGIFARTISYGCGRQYRAMVIKIKEKI